MSEISTGMSGKKFTDHFAKIVEGKTTIILIYFCSCLDAEINGSFTGTSVSYHKERRLV